MHHIHFLPCLQEFCILQVLLTSLAIKNSVPRALPGVVVGVSGFKPLLQFQAVKVESKTFVLVVYYLRVECHFNNKRFYNFVS